jgi:hypothetical protein
LRLNNITTDSDYTLRLERRTVYALLHHTRLWFPPR